METQVTKFFPFQAGSYFMLALKFESSGLYTSSTKKKFPFSHIPFRAGYTTYIYACVVWSGRKCERCKHISNLLIKMAK